MDQYLAIYTPVAELANRIDLGEPPLRRPLSATLADFFGSTWLIWVIGSVIIGIVVYRG